MITKEVGLYRSCGLTTQLLLSIPLNITVFVVVVSTGLRFVRFTKKELKKKPGQNQTIKRRSFHPTDGQTDRHLWQKLSAWRTTWRQI